MTQRALQTRPEVEIRESEPIVEELPYSPVVPLEETFADMKKLLGPDENIASTIVDAHRMLFAEQAHKKIEEIKAAEPEANLVAEGWEAKMAGAPEGLSCGMGYAVVLEPPPLQVSVAQRAAGLIFAAADLYTQIDNPTLLRGLDEGKLMETKGYRRIFGSMRIPGERADSIRHTDVSDYIIVTCKSGGMYKLQVIRYGLPIPQEELEEALNVILETEKISSQAEPSPKNVKAGVFSLRRFSSEPKNPSTTSLAPLSWLPRRRWAAIRKRLKENSSNTKAFEEYEKGLFTVSLDDTSYPATLEEVAQLTQYGQISGPNSIEGRNLNTVTESGINFTVFANGHAGAKAEHLIADGNIFSRVVNSINKKARSATMRTLAGTPELQPTRSRALGPRQSQELFRRLDWEIPQEYITEAESYHKSEMEKRNMAYVMIEGVGAVELGYSKVDACMQIAIQCAFADIRNDVLRSRNKNSKKATDFVALEPTRARSQKGGRLTNAATSTPEVRRFIEQSLEPNSNLSEKKLLEKAIDSVKREVRKASEDKGYTSQLMALTAVLKRGNAEESAAYLNLMEKLFVKLHPAISKIINPELMASSGGRSDQADATAGFCTVDPLGKHGISVGYMPGTLGKPTKMILRAKGKYKNSCELMAQRLEYHLRRIHEILNAPE